AAEGNGNSFSAYLASEGGAVRIETINVFASSYQGGVRVAVGDVTGDGVDDIIAGGGNGTGGKVVVYDGLTFEPLPGVLGGFSALGRTYRGGVYVAAGDINSDGFYDVIVGAAAGSSNQVRIYSGADGSLLNAFRAFPAGSGGVRV